MAFTPADERAVHAARFTYHHTANESMAERARERRRAEVANQVLPPVAAQVCQALRQAMGPAEELRRLVPMLSYGTNIGSGLSVRYDAIALTDRQVHLVFAGSATGVQAHAFPYGVLDADTKLLKLTPELEDRRGRPTLVVPRVAGREAKWDAMFAAPPPGRDPELDAAPAGGSTLPPPGWHPDPSGRHQLRWWDGSRWTEHASTSGTTVVDPI